MGIRVFHADDHAVFRDAVRAVLEAEPDVRVVGEAGTMAETLERTKALRPDVAICDLSMPGGAVLAGVRRLRAASPATQVLILTMFDGAAYVREAIASGAAGYVLKEAPGEELVRALRCVASGQGYLAANVTMPVLRQLAEDARLAQSRSPLSAREIEILEWIAAGAANKEIASRLGISEVTVKAHLRSIFSRIGAQNRAHAVTIALQQSLIRVEGVDGPGAKDFAP